MYVVGGVLVGILEVDAIHVKGMIACNYRMPIQAPSEIDSASMTRLAPILSMVTLHVRNEHEVFDNTSR
jgi:hypothetical protein